ncbi:hypothetical protein BDV36DRAFT_73933 [Aspergillus pseudocaelatus]|uniref:Uncharacterized protein n=1 Tax=Aspergillus pseudocaelatus TaxID=1825620 RepID=A0ABQ6W5G8_9EURO|nr:hypothetical protein BDV36DRAFT_73933 [Aspergillus pseudocaelatus]
MLSKTNSLYVFRFTGLHSFPFHSAFASNFVSSSKHGIQLFSVPPTTTLLCSSSPSHSSLSLSLVCIPIHVCGALCCMSLSFSIGDNTVYYRIHSLLAFSFQLFFLNSFTEDSIAPNFLHILYLYLHLFTYCITFLLALSVPDQ